MLIRDTVSNSRLGSWHVRGFVRCDAERNNQVRQRQCPFFKYLTLATSVRTKLIDDQKRPGGPKYRGLVHGTVSIVREEGIGGIYRGLFPVVSR